MQEEAVEAAQLEAAYASFAGTLRAGGFGDPPDGWNAELIAAHVCVNNDLISETAERLGRGEDVAYDNSPAVGEDDLMNYAARSGGLSGLADAIGSSAARLARSHESLSEADRAREIPVIIWDDGSIAREGPMPIGDLIVGNATFHLDMHHEQLRALAP
jgi:hypothetical protein